MLFSHQVVSDSSWPYGLQHPRLPYPSLSPGVYPSSCPLNLWCHPTISSSVILFSFCLQSFPASGSFPMSQLFPFGGQSIGASASASVLPKSILFRIDWFDFLAFQGTLKSLLQHHNQKASVLRRSVFLKVQLLQSYMTPGKTIALTIRTIVSRVMSLLFNPLSRFVITFLPRSKHLLILWLQSPSAVILEPKKISPCYFHCFPIYLPWSDGTRCHDLSFLNVEL